MGKEHAGDFEEFTPFEPADQAGAMVDAECGVFFFEAVEQIGFGGAGKVAFRQRALGMRQQVLGAALEHRAGRAHRVVPINIAIHQIIGKDEGLDRGYALVRNGRALGCTVVCN